MPLWYSLSSLRWDFAGFKNGPQGPTWRNESNMISKLRKASKNQSLPIRLKFLIHQVSSFQTEAGLHQSGKHKWKAFKAFSPELNTRFLFLCLPVKLASKHLHAASTLAAGVMKHVSISLLSENWVADKVKWLVTSAKKKESPDSRKVRRLLQLDRVPATLEEWRASGRKTLLSSYMYISVAKLKSLYRLKLIEQTEQMLEGILDGRPPWRLPWHQAGKSSLILCLLASVTQYIACI